MLKICNVLCLFLFLSFSLPSFVFSASFTAEWQPELVAQPSALPGNVGLVLDARQGTNSKEYIPSSIRVDWKNFYTKDGSKLLPTSERKALLAALGVTDDGKILVYDNGPQDGGAFMVFWLLESVGVRNVSVLEGGFPAYKRAGGKVVDTPAKSKMGKITDDVSGNIAVSLSQLMEIFGDYDLMLIDPRSDEEYNGWPLNDEKRGGHIRTALSYNPMWAYTADGFFKQEQDIRLAMYRKGITPEKQFLTYSNFDTRGAAMYYLLRVMGYQNVGQTDFTLNVWADNPLLPMSSAKNWQALVSPEWVYELITTGKALTFENKKYAIYDISFGISYAEKRRELAGGVGTIKPSDLAYKAGHIPGAFHMDSDTIEDKDRYWDLAAPDMLFPRLAEKGIDIDTTVILYGHGATIGASFTFWALKTAGVKDVRLLNGNFERWVSKGLPVETRINTPTPVKDFGLKGSWGNPQYSVSVDQAAAMLKEPDARVVSIRHWPEYTGQVVLHAYIPDRGEALGTYWGRAGFGKNTSNLTFYIDEDGSYRSYTEVAKMWSDLDVLPSHKVAFSCGTGPRASTGWFFSYLMGWPDTALFDSGWLGWSEGKPQSPRPSQNIWDSVHNDKQLKEGGTKELPL